MLVTYACIAIVIFTVSLFSGGEKPHSFKKTVKKSKKSQKTKSQKKYSQKSSKTQSRQSSKSSSVPQKAKVVAKASKKHLVVSMSPIERLQKDPNAKRFHHLKKPLWSFVSQGIGKGNPSFIKENKYYFGFRNIIEVVDLQTGQKKHHINFPETIAMESQGNKILAARHGNPTLAVAISNPTQIEKVPIKYKHWLIKGGLFYTTNSSSFCAQDSRGKVIFEIKREPKSNFFKGKNGLYHVLNKTMYKHSLKNGKVLWKHAIKGNINWQWNLKPIAKDDLVFYKAKDTFFVVDGKSGKTRWKKKLALYQTLKKIGSFLYLPTKTKMYVVYARTGKIRSALKIKEGLRSFQVGVKSKGKKIYLCYANGLYAFSVRKKKKRWFFPVKGSGAFIAGKKNVYLLSNSHQNPCGYLYVLNAKTGKIKWVFEIKNNFPFASNIFSQGDNVYIRGHSPTFLMALSKKTSPETAPEKFTYAPLSVYNKGAYIKFQKRAMPKIHKMNFAAPPTLRTRPDIPSITTIRGDAFRLLFHLAHIPKKVAFQITHAACTGGNVRPLTIFSLSANNQNTTTYSFEEQGYAPTRFDITKDVKLGENIVTLRTEQAFAGGWVLEFSVCTQD